MCGIAGVIEHNNAYERTARMTESLAHRGPDGWALFSDGRIALGHARLAILDLSAGGQQPMTDGRWTIVFNGEIFNYLELRAELTSQGVDFRTTSDTEVLLAACAFWGCDATLPKLIGMFAFALWDSKDQSLRLVRDRVGEKPLVYFFDGRTLAFASEMKALAEFHHARLAPAAVDAYLALGYVPAPLGIFEHTAKLQAGHCAVWHKGTFTTRRWWHPEQAATATPDAAENPAELKSLLGDVVRLRLRSDVPVALALSGGVDSSVVAVELVRLGQNPDAFTVVFDEDAQDLPYAQSVARHLGLRHEVIHARKTSFVEAVARSVCHYDEPFADSSGIACLALGEALAGRYKVILNGDGGDEAFAGYPHYEFVAAKQAVKAAAAAAGLRDGVPGKTVYVESKVLFREEERQAMLDARVPAGAFRRLLETDAFLARRPQSALKNALWTDRHLYLANDLTYKADIALSAFGIEGRSPFLDHRILEWAQGLSAAELVRGREKKIVLRQAYAGVLPAQILSRKKRGFGAPIDKWLAGPLAGSVQETLAGSPLICKTSGGGQRDWAVYTFALWAETWGARW